MRPTMVRMPFGEVVVERVTAPMGPAAKRQAQMVFNVSGDAFSISADGKRIEVKPAQAASINAMQTVTRAPLNGQPSVNLVISAHADWIAEKTDRPIPPSGEVFANLALPVAGIVKTCRDVILVGMRMPAFIRAPLLEHQMAVLFRFAIAKCGFSVADHVNRHGSSFDRRVSLAIDHLDATRGAPASNQTLADISGISRTQFYESFKSATGLTPNQYATMLRIEHAVELLCETEAPISDVAFDLGFDSQANFTRFMKKTTSLTPKQFRRACINFTVEQN